MFPIDRSSLAQTALVALLTLAALAMLGATLAYWTWAWFAPPPEPRAPAAAEPLGNVASAGTLFGRVPRTRAAAAPTGMAIRLLGVVASARSPSGYAVVQLEPRQIRAVREGEDLAPGIRLAEVHADHVVLERNGVRETLAWPEKGRTGAAPAPPTAASKTSG